MNIISVRHYFRCLTVSLDVWPNTDYIIFLISKIDSFFKRTFLGPKFTKISQCEYVIIQKAIAIYLRDFCDGITRLQKRFNCKYQEKNWFVQEYIHYIRGYNQQSENRFAM